MIQPPHIDRSKITGGELKIDPFVNEFNEKQAMTRALSLNMKVYPRGTPLKKEMETFFVINASGNTLHKQGTSASRNTSPGVLSRLKPDSRIQISRQFIVDSGACYHPISRKDCTRRELKTVRKAEPV